MSSASRRSERQHLERELRGPSYEALLRQLQAAFPHFSPFDTWEDVLLFMHGGTSEDPRKNDVLRSIFHSYRRDQDPKWRAVLLAIFWPGLESVYRRKLAWDPDADELWQSVLWAFIQVTDLLDVSKRPGHLARRVCRGTTHRLHDKYRILWNRTARETPTDPDKLEEIGGEAEDPQFAAVEARDLSQSIVRRFRRHLEAGHIREADFLLLVGTRAYGQSLAQHARQAGMSYQAAKKRRQRAEAAIRRFEEENEEF